jgi:hypothetical protein
MNTHAYDIRSSIVPRLIRLRDAPAYLGMDKNRFNREVRPHLIVVPIGRQGIAFDRIDLDAWAEHHKRCNGRPGAQSERSELWEANERQVSPSVVGSGMSTKSIEESAFERALAQARSAKPDRRDSHRAALRSTAGSHVVRGGDEISDGKPAQKKHR